jgi:hypothetical protein
MGLSRLDGQCSSIIDVVSTAVQICRQTGYWSFVPPFLSPARSAFLPHSERLSRKEMSKEACRLERAPCGPAASPTTLTCMLTCIRAWPAFIGVSLQQASPIRDMPGQGRCRSLNQKVEEAVSPFFANATHGRKRGAYFLMHSGQHWLDTDTPDIGRPCPTFL